ncbi:hypothetical protein [Arsenophonus apicola]|uniref:Uncharacterized protein n=1 Tax=Arsenophonus apicola TaxID=2879119 RepID=A0ABY8P477_9GAMM|nr:hypothetical protein [Arsenophonus apicola]WGO84295.1 hypothetical protein QG404_05225 [Arsenophonus apicola]
MVFPDDRYFVVKTRSATGSQYYWPINFSAAMAQYPDALKLESLASKPLFIISYLAQAE